MNIENLLSVIASAVLEEIHGPGYWSDGHKDGFKAIKNPLTGLNVGDVVYFYCEDGAILNETVIAVVDGIGYTLYDNRPFQFELRPVSAAENGTTIKQVVDLYRQNILDDFKYADEVQERVSKLKAMCEEYL